MKEDAWLKQIKERLDDYSEPLPASGWDRLEKELSAMPKPAKPLVVPFYRRWSTAAAAALLLAVSSLSLWLAQSPVHQTIQQAVSEAAQETSSWVPATPLPAETLQPRVDVASTLAAVSIPAEETSVLLSEPASEPVSTSPSDTVLVSPPQESEHTVSSPEATSTQRTPRYRPSSRDKYHLPVSPASSTTKRGWSVALAVANTGGFSSVQQAGGNKLMQADGSVLSHDGLFDLSASAQDILFVPEGQNLVFQEGIPMLKGCTRQIAEVDHQQPISVGFLLRKNLSHGFSLETGIQYTYLSSDITFAGGDGLKQKLHYLGIPLRANWSFWQKERLEMYVSAGGALEKCVYGKFGSEQHSVKPLQFSVLGAVGIQLNLSQQVGLYVEPGVSYYFDDGSQVETIRKENPCNFTLQGGIRFTY